MDAEFMRRRRLWCARSTFYQSTVEHDHELTKQYAQRQPQGYNYYEWLITYSTGVYPWNWKIAQIAAVKIKFIVNLLQKIFTHKILCRFY